jgi:hypothetical protein
MTRLLFVYNADDGLIAGMMDSVHKLVSPATYQCSLCAITHGIFRMDPKWRAWLDRAPYDVVFHHKPDFRAAYPGLDVKLPAVLLDAGDGPEPLLRAEELGAVENVDMLIAVIEGRLASRG